MKLGIRVHRHLRRLFISKSVSYGQNQTTATPKNIPLSEKSENAITKPRIKLQNYNETEWVTVV